MKYYILYATLILIVICNTIDASCTAYLYDSGLIDEANPLMEHLISTSIYNFVLIKSFLGLAGVFILFRLRDNLVNSWLFTLVIMSTFIYIGIVVRYSLWLVLGS